VTEIISVLSGKGGAGKTTVTANLGVTLEKQGKDVLIIDGNFTGANIAQHFGLGFQDVSLNQVLDGEKYAPQAVTKHPSGVSILPSSVLEFDADEDNLKHSVIDFLGNKDYVLIDAAAGTGPEAEAAVQASETVLLVAEPELPAVTNCLGAKKLAEKHGKNIAGVVVNGVRDEKTEVEDMDVKEVLEEPIIGKVPDHRHVREGIAVREPVTSHKPMSPATKAFDNLGHRLRGQQPPKESFSTKMVRRIKGILD
jgi:septum site-determining protein MinD